MVTASGGEGALAILGEQSPDLTLLDIMMPVMDGYTVCRRIRQFSQMPIIMVTAKCSEDEKVKGLDAGADDYVTKPFSAREVVARVGAALRRTMSLNKRPSPVFHSGDLVMDFARQKVSIGGQEINLTATQYRLLTYLAHNVGRVLTPDQILEEVWGEPYLGEAHLLQVNIGRLRQRLGDDARNPRYIATRQGIGYTMLKQA